jgi:hypothetical protein
LDELEAQLAEIASEDAKKLAEKPDPLNPFLPSLDSTYLHYQRFIELACTSFLSDVCICVASYNDIFIDPYKRSG